MSPFRSFAVDLVVSNGRVRTMTPGSRRSIEYGHVHESFDLINPPERRLHYRRLTGSRQSSGDGYLYNPVMQQ